MSLLLPLNLLFGQSTQQETPDSGQPHYRREYSVTPGNLFKPAWEYARRCTGLKPQRGGNYKDVVWRLVSPGQLVDPLSGTKALGLWTYPDTIRLDSLWSEASWVIIHELIHHLNRGTPLGHPEQFRQCMVLTPQNVPYIPMVVSEQ